MNPFIKTSFDADSAGHFGQFGGRYAPEMLIPALEDLEYVYKKAIEDSTFIREFTTFLHEFAARPTPLIFAENLTKKLGGAKIYLKNEGANPTGAHKFTHCVGQALLAKRMGKTRLIAETGAGQHGMATAAVAAKFGFSCTVYMGEVDIARQRPNVFWMELLGAKVIPVSTGSKTLKDAVNAALKDWITNVGDTHYLLGSTLGPHPYPSMNRDFQTIVGLEVKAQLGCLPDVLVACVGGGSNSMGLFNAFLDEPKVRLIGVEAGGRLGRKKKEVRSKNSKQFIHAARFKGGVVGVVEGYKSYFLQDEDGNISQTHSISAGLDYAGIGPQLAYLHDRGRVEFTYATDKEAIGALKLLATTEGVIPALESAHAVAYARKLAPTLPKEKIMVVNISGRGDKDIFIVAEALKDKNWMDFLKKKTQ